MHYQCFAIILHKFINLTVIGDIALRFIVQQNIFHPITDIVFCKQQAVILGQAARKYRLQIFPVKEIAVQLH